MWYTQWKDKRLVDSGPIKWEYLKVAFLEKYFPRERRDVKLEEFINLKQGNMRVEEYSLKFTMLLRYGPSLVSNLRNEMSRFMTSVADIVKEECHKVMLHSDMNLSMLMVNAQSIEESKLGRIDRNLKRSGSNEQNQPMFKRRAPNNDVPSALRSNLRRVVVLKMVSLHVLLVGRSSMGNV